VLIVASLSDENPRVRNASLIALARLNRVEPAAAILKLCDDADPIVRHTAVQSLIALKAAAASFAVVDQTSVTPNTRTGALRVLQALHDPAVVSGLIARLEKEGDAARQLDLFAALCRLHFREGEWKGNSWGTRPDTSGPYYQPEPWSESEKIVVALKSAFDSLPQEQTATAIKELSRHKMQLDGSLTKLIELASTNEALLPTLADEVQRSNQLPPAAVPLLKKIVTNAEIANAPRSQAIQALAKSDDASVWLALLEGVSTLDQKGRGKAEVNRARDAVLKSAKLETQLKLLIAEAAKGKEGTSLWAEACLVSLLANKGTSVEVKAQAQTEFDSALKDTKRRGQVLEAIGLAEARSLGEHVLAAEHDADEKIAQIATRIVKQLNLDAEKNKKANSPLVESLSVEEVIARVVSSKGNVSLGQSVFTKLECAKCHTVKADEPPKGPFLGTIANTYKRKELAESIMIPSKTLAQGFVTNLVVTDDGKQHIGFVVLEAADKIVLRNAEAKEIEIPVASIEERNKLPTSVMPEGLAKKITVDELASLVDYIESLPKK
jgi:putative heme-binding domain-containing protein